MEDDIIVKDVLKKSLVAYYGVIAFAVVVAVAGWMWSRTAVDFEMGKGLKTTVQSVSYMYLFISIPFALWWYSRESKKLKESSESAPERGNKLLRLSFLRIGLIGVVFIGNLLLLYVSRDFSFLYASGIGAIALLFCKLKKEEVEDVIINKEPNIE